MNNTKILSNKEIEEIIAGWDESGDEFGEDESEKEFEMNPEILPPIESDDNDLYDNVNIPETFADERETTIESFNIPSTSHTLVDPRIAAKELKNKYARVIWKKTDFPNKTDEFVFKGDSTLPNCILHLYTPYRFFKYIWNDELMENIVEQSMLYSSQIDPSHPLKVNAAEISQYIGICLMMSVVTISNTRKYWSPVIGNKLIQETMTVNRYEKIRKFIHFNVNTKMLPRSHADHDRLFKIRPIVRLLQKTFRSVPHEECLSIDEQLCSTKARSYLKQYLPDKPHKWGYKLFVLSGVSGFTYNFEIYTGQENDQSKRLPNEPDLGCSANIVIRLLRNVPKFENFRVYFDNYYSTLL